MSNRALALLGFAAFMLAFIYEMETLSDRSRSLPSSCNCQQAQPPSLHRLETYLFMVHSELALANELAAESVKQAHPDRAAEVQYWQFSTLVAQMRSSAGQLKFRPLRDGFKADYEALKARYAAEHPDVQIPE